MSTPSRRRIPLLGFGCCLCSVTLLVALTGCASDSSSATMASAPPSENDAMSASISPGSEKSRREAREWQEAIEGIAFVDGRVIVTEPAPLVDLDEMMAYLALGDQRLEQNHKTSAVKAYRQAIQVAPGKALPYDALGRALLGKGKVDLALAAYATAIDLEPQRIESRLEHAETLGRLGRYADALDAMAATLAVDPTAARAHKRSAVWAYYLGDLDAARRHADRAAALGDPVPPQLQRMLEDAE